MVQTVRSITLLSEEKIIMLEKPQALHRIFFSIQAFADQNVRFRTNISFDDPQFRSFYVLDGPARYFEATGEDIFQGNIWVRNQSDVDLVFAVTEILH